MAEHARLKRRRFHAPSIVLGDGPERVRFAPGRTFAVPAHKEKDFALPPFRGNGES